MSVVFQSEVGIILDHLRATQNWYKLNEGIHFNCIQEERIHTHFEPQTAVDDNVQGYCKILSGDKAPIEETDLMHSKKDKGYKMKADLFAIESPFMMDSQIERLMCQTSDDLSKTKETSADRKRRKKMKTVNTCSDEKIFTHIKTVLTDLISHARTLNYLSQVTTTFHKNDVAKAAAKLHGCGDLFQLLCIETDKILGYDNVDEYTVTSDLFLEGKRQCTAQSLIRTCVRNGNVGVIKIDNQDYLIPEKSSFLTSSFHYFTTIGYHQISLTEGYDLIVIDPPWENKSVKRKKSYNTLDEIDLKLLPIKTLSKDGCFICIWVTNNERIINFVKEELFPHWSVEWKADWLWVKVTKSGEPICKMTSFHKKPYEQLIIGKYFSSSGQRINSFISLNNIQNKMNDSVKNLENSLENFEMPEQSFMSISEKLATGENNEKPCAVRENQCKACTCLNTDDKEKKKTSAKSDYIPQSFLIVTIPCSLHSKKPPISEVFIPYLPKNPNCIELFARNLVPGWTSWGNEPLKHQHLDYYEEVLN